MAQELNAILDTSQAGRLLSPFGRRIYFPKGILTQAQEAAERAHKYDATIGMAYSKGVPVVFRAVKKELPLLSPKESVAYAPTAGIPELRKIWKEGLGKKNPHLDPHEISVPVAVPGLTAGISFTADLFLTEGDSVVIPDLNWPNYRLVLEERKGAVIVTFPTFVNGGFNVPGFEAALMKTGAEKKRAAFILNFPNNPTGYSPTFAEVDELKAAVVRVASSGIAVLAVSDDAYFGLQYEADAVSESLFSFFSCIHENVLAVKVDGSTKEDCVWGFRSAFVTFGGKSLDTHHYEALVKKLMGVVRSAISNSPAPTQYIMIKAMKDPTYEEDKNAFRAMMLERYNEVRRVLKKLGANPRLEILPFNSGYFMCFECKGVSAETLRLKLLDGHGVGTIALGEKYLRVAFSCVEKEEIEELYTIIYETSKTV